MVFERWLQPNCVSYIGRGRGHGLQFFHALDNQIGIFQAVSSDSANNAARFWNFFELILRLLLNPGIKKARQWTPTWLVLKEFFVPAPPNPRPGEFLIRQHVRRRNA